MSEQKSTYSAAKWWKEAVVYQIYPSSFQSHPGNKTGWGSVKGITSRLDYLKDLGVNVVWLSPIYLSPQVDMGYDIADYQTIDPRYGSLADVDELIHQLKQRNMHLMMDLVANHTSNQHAWFRESATGPASPKRDWYIWRPAKHIDAATGLPVPPNNWAQILGEANSAWSWHPESRAFYLALFSPEQPDLNWENPAVRKAVWDVMRFWIGRGAAGFRLDVINHISKVPGFPDAQEVLGPEHRFHPGREFFVNGPRLHEFLREMHEQVLRGSQVMTVGEMPDVYSEDEIVQTVGAETGELTMIFIFDLVDIDKETVRMTLKPWNVLDMKRVIARWQRVMIERNGWNTVFIENHDNPRSVSRFTDDSDEYREKGAKLLALMETTLGGTLFVYQGQEIGMRSAPRDWPVAEFKDVETINYWQKMQALYPNDEAKAKEAREMMHIKARDHARTPMHWSAEPNAGFCDADVKPWMSVLEDHKAINVQEQRDYESPNDLSVWQFWTRAIKQRLSHKEVFVYGDFKEITPNDPNVFSYIRSSDSGERWLVVLNFSKDEREWSLPADPVVESWVVGTYCKNCPEKPLSGSISLKPWEGILGKMK